MKAIEQAIEARALKLAESRLEDERGLYEWALDAEITLRECAAALTALRSMPAEPVGFMSEKQLAAIKDPEGEHGHYIPMRKTPAGNFTLPLYTTPPPAPVLSDAILAHLDDLKDDAAVHIYPSDLVKCRNSECVVEVFSVRAGCPAERTVPLFSREQVAEAIEQAIGRASRGAK